MCTSFARRYLRSIAEEGWRPVTTEHPLAGAPPAVSERAFYMSLGVPISVFFFVLTCPLHLISPCVCCCLPLLVSALSVRRSLPSLCSAAPTTLMRPHRAAVLCGPQPSPRSPRGGPRRQRGPQRSKRKPPLCPRSARPKLRRSAIHSGGEHGGRQRPRWRRAQSTPSATAR